MKSLTSDEITSRAARLTEVYKQANACTSCSIHVPLKVKARTYWTGQIDLRADVFVIGSHPYEIEATSLYGAPFTTKEAKPLQDIIHNIGLDNDVYFTNLIQCPTIDRDPDLNEIRNCSQFLHAQIDILKPKMIVTVGSLVTNVVSNHLVDMIPMRELLKKQLFYKNKDHNIPIVPIFGIETWNIVENNEDFIFSYMKEVYNRQWRRVQEEINHFQI